MARIKRGTTFAVERETVACSHCALVQFMTASTNCRRCHKSLLPPPEPVASVVIARDFRAQCLNDAIGPVVRVLRLARGLSQSQFAKLCGCPRSYISKLERGGTSPLLRTLVRLAVAFDVPLIALVRLIEAAATAGKEAP